MMRILVICLLFACGTNEGTNVCATRGFTYIQHNQETSGNCGPMPNIVMNVEQDGTITFPSNISCQHVVQDSCTINSLDCSFANNGISCTENIKAVFTSDGSSASGTIVLNCIESGAACTSTYSSTMTKE